MGHIAAADQADFEGLILMIMIVLMVLIVLVVLIVLSQIITHAGISRLIIVPFPEIDGQKHRHSNAGTAGRHGRLRRFDRATDARQD